MTDGAGRRGAGVRGRCAASAWGDIAVCFFSRSLPVYRKRATPGLASVTRRAPCCGASLHGGAAVCIHRSQLSNYTGLICHLYVKRLFFCASIVPVCEKAVLRALCGSNRGRIWPPAASLAAYSGSERLFQRFRDTKALQAAIGRPAAYRLLGGHSVDAEAGVGVGACVREACYSSSQGICAEARDLERGRGIHKGRPGDRHLIGRGFSGDGWFSKRPGTVWQQCRRGLLSLRGRPGAKRGKASFGRELRMPAEADNRQSQCSISTHSSSTPRRTICSLKTGSEARRIEGNRASRLVKAMRPSRMASGEPRQ